MSCSGGVFRDRDQVGARRHHLAHRPARRRSCTPPTSARSSSARRSTAAPSRQRVRNSVAARRPAVGQQHAERRAPTARAAACATLVTCSARRGGEPARRQVPAEQDDGHRHQRSTSGARSDVPDRAKTAGSAAPSRMTPNDEVVDAAMRIDSIRESHVQRRGPAAQLPRHGARQLGPAHVHQRAPAIDAEQREQQPEQEDAPDHAASPEPAPRPARTRRTDDPAHAPTRHLVHLELDVADPHPLAGARDAAELARAPGRPRC